MNIQTLTIMIVITLIVSLIVYMSWAKATGRKLNLGLALIPLLLILATGGYFILGNPLASDPSEKLAKNGDVGQFIGAVEGLEKKAAANPENLDYQIMLAHSYRAMGRYDQAVAAFGKAWEKVKNSPQELSLFAGTLAIWRGSFEGKPDELLAQALKLDPNHPDALMLMGGSAYQKQNYQQAIATWQKISLDKLEEDDKKWVQQQIQDAQEILIAPEKASQTQHTQHSLHEE